MKISEAIQKMIKTSEGTKPVTEKVIISPEPEPETMKLENIDGIPAEVIKKLIPTSKGTEEEIKKEIPKEDLAAENN
jgi:hypothetical protein